MGALPNIASDEVLLRHDGMHRWLRCSTPEGPVLRKVLEPALAMDGRRARAWLQRVERNRELHVEAGAQVVDAGLDASGVWVTSRYAEGSTLAEAMRGASVELALYAAHSLLRVLEAGHALALVHLDLDPEGILVRADGTLSLSELGLWSALAPSELARVRFDADRVAYLAPEQVQARPADARSDLFVLGWLLYEWLAGRPPYAGATAQELAAAIDGGQHTPLAQLGSRVPLELCDVVDMLMQPDPACRFQTASAARGALEAVARFGVNDANDARRELAERVRKPARIAKEPRTRLGLGQRARELPSHDKAPVSALIEPPPLFLSSVKPETVSRGERALRGKGEPVHDGRTAFVRVETALRSVLSGKRTSAARTAALRVAPGKWQEPSSTLFRVRRAALVGPVVRVASWPRAWWVALGFGLGGPCLACVYLLCRLCF